MTMKRLKPTFVYTPFVFTVLALMILNAGCQSNSPEFTARVGTSVAKQMAPATSNAAATGGAMGAGMPTADKEVTPQQPMPRKIIYTAEIVLVVDDLAPVEMKLKETLKAHNGFVASANVTGSKRGERSGTWKVRIPVDKFEAFLQQAGSLGEVQSSNTQSDDVSEEYYDVTARIKNKRVEEERLIQHLKASTGKLSEILTVEKEISRVREELERMEGRLRFLTNQTDLTTVTITVNEAKGYVPESTPTFRNQIGRTFGSSLTMMADFFKGLVLIVIGVLPWLLLLGLPALLVYRLYKKRKVKG
jgi:hypothetical protein